MIYGVRLRRITVESVGRDTVHRYALQPEIERRESGVKSGRDIHVESSNHSLTITFPRTCASPAALTAVVSKGRPTTVHTSSMQRRHSRQSHQSEATPSPVLVVWNSRRFKAASPASDWFLQYAAKKDAPRRPADLERLAQLRSRAAPDGRTESLAALKHTE